MQKLRASSSARWTRQLHLSQRCWNALSDSRSRQLNALIGEVSASDCDGTIGPLHGRCIVVKDNIVDSATSSTAASKILGGYTSPFEATVVRLLRKNGASILGKANLDEFGMGSHSQDSSVGAVLSPYKRAGVALSPGGSSGGSAVAVATKQSWAALGTDTGGSIRLPAAYCDVVGFKPSYGLISRWGVIQYANSLDTVGILANTVEDARLVFRTVNEYDDQDPTSLADSVRVRVAQQRRSLPDKLRIGVPGEYVISELSSEVRSAFGATLKALEARGHTLQTVSLPTTRQALSAYYILAPAEASSNLAKYDGIRYGERVDGLDATVQEKLPLYARTRGEMLGTEVQRRILLGAYTLSSGAMDNYFLQAQKVRRLVQQDFNQVFATQHPLCDYDGGQGCSGPLDILLTPTAPTLPPTIEEVKKQTLIERYMNDVFTVPASLAGLPSTSIPIPLTDEHRALREEQDIKMTGVQVIGQFGDDELVLHASKIIEDLR